MSIPRVVTNNVQFPSNISVRGSEDRDVKGIRPAAEGCRIVDFERILLS